MGNAISGDSSSSGHAALLDDNACLDIQNSAIFNDAYVAEVFEGLPVYPGTEINKKVDNTDQEPAQDDLKLQKLVEVFGKGSSMIPRVEDFKKVFLAEADGAEASAKLLKMRSRLLHHMHLAYSRQLDKSKPAGQGPNISDNFLESGSKGSDFENADALLTATSIQMSLTIMACLGPQNPTLFREFSNSLTDLLARSSPMAFAKIRSGSPQGESVRAIISHANQIIATSAGVTVLDDRSRALGLLFALAVASGSVGDVLTLASHLQGGLDCLPSSAKPFMDRLGKMQTIYDLSFPVPYATSGEFDARTTQKPPDDITKVTSLASDGMYLYFWNGYSKSISKIGTGFHGTIAGHEYVINTDIEQLLNDYLGEEVYGKETRAEQQGESTVSIRAVQGRLLVTKRTFYFVINEGDDPMNAIIHGDFSDQVEVSEDTDFVYYGQLEIPADEDESRPAAVFYDIGNSRYLMGVSPRSEDEDDEEEEEEDEDQDQSRSASRLSRSVRPCIDIIEPIADREVSSSSGSNIGASRDHIPAYVVCANGKLYLWMTHLLGPFRIAVLSTNALKLEDVVDITLPIPSYKKALKEWKKKLSEIRSTEKTELDDGESKEETILQEEKNADEDEATEETLETRLGPEECLSSPGTGVRIDRLSSTNENFSGSAIEQLCQGNFGEDASEPFFFGDSDEEQIVMLDLGQLYAPSAFGARFHSDNQNEEFERRVASMEISLSANNLEFFDWSPMSPVTEVETTIVSGNDYRGPAEIKYVRFRFVGKGSVVQRLLVKGKQKTLVAHKLQFPALCSDGRNLFFIYSNESKKSEDNSGIIVAVADPLQRMNIKSTVTFNTDIDSNRIAEGSFASNGENLLFVARKGVRSAKDKKAEYSCYRFNLLSAKESGSHDYSFSASQGFPVSVSYDSRNNTIWSFDWVQSRVLRWRNAGFAPRFLPPRPSTTKELLLSESPQYRLEGLELLSRSGSNSAGLEAARIICHIDRMAEIHGPSPSPMAEARSLDEVEISCAGPDDGNFCKINVRGQTVFEVKRGFNLVVLTDNLEPGETRYFDTHDSANASERMADYIDGISEGRIVLVGTFDSVVTNITSRGYSALKLLGADRPEKLAKGGAFALIGRKGAPSNSSGIVQAIAEKKKGPITIRHRLPSPRIPLAVDDSMETLRTLIALINKQYAVYKTDKASDIDIVILLSAIRLCTVHFYHFLRGNSSDVLAAFLVAEERTSLINFVMEMIDKPPQNEVAEAIAKTALRLFITAIDVLYPSAAEKCTLLVKYLDEFAAGDLSQLEKSVLEILLRQMSNVASMAKLLGSSNDGGIHDPTILMASLASIAENEVIARLDGMIKSQQITSENDVGNAAVQMLSTVCNMLLSQGVKAFLSNPESSPECQAGIQMVINIFTKLCDISIRLISNGVRVNETLALSKDKSDPYDIKLDDEISEILKTSPVGALLPISLFTLSRVVSENQSRILSSNCLTGVLEQLVSCFVCIEDLISKIPKKRFSQTVLEVSGSKVSSITLESEHPYASNSDLTFEIKFPGAVRFTIVFDEESKTENNYDFVKIWRSPEKTDSAHPEIEKLTGRGGTENWPGCGGRPPLVVEGDYALVEFHSDGSNEDWGWKLTATAEFKKAEVSGSLHWAAELERELGACGASIASCLITGTPWSPAIETPNAAWMEEELLHGDYKTYDTLESIPIETQFLLGLISRPHGSPSAELCKKMKSYVTEDRGQVDDINRVVYATAAAAIKHNNLTAEAIAFASGLRSAPSELLVKVWRASQKMRSYFELADVRGVQVEAIESMGGMPPSLSLVRASSHTALMVDPKHDDDDMPPPTEMPSLIRVPSLYSGAGRDAIREASQQVVERCKFLICIELDVPSHNEDESSPVDSKKKKGGWKMLAKLTNAQEKTATMLKSQSGDGSRFAAVVDAAQIQNKVKEMITYRRVAARKKSGKATITERVLSFVQSNVSVAQLEQIRSLRSLRSKQRSQGLDLVRSMISAGPTPQCLVGIVSCVPKSLRDALSPESPSTLIQLTASIEGCSPADYSSVAYSFHGYVDACVDCMISSFHKFAANKHLFDKAVVLSCFRGLAFDYDTQSSSILERTSILDSVKLLVRSEDADINQTAWSLFELMLLRCSGVRADSDAPNAFSNQLVSFLVAELESQSKASTQDVCDEPPKLKTAPVVLTKSIKRIEPGTVGLVAPHIPVGLKHTMSLWVRRKAGAFEDSIKSGTPQVGMAVKAGPDFDYNSVSETRDEMLSMLGTIVEVSSDRKKVTVVWKEKGPRKTYNFGFVVDDVPKFEVSLCDRSIGGTIYSKGMMSLLKPERMSLPWSSFGLELYPDSALRFRANYSEMSTYFAAGSKAIPADEWTHVAVVQNEKSTRIYVNGELDVEDEIANDMLYADAVIPNIHVVESKHPYADNTDEYTVVEVPGATSYSITFDALSRTEANYDYIVFYQDDSHTSYYGNEKYSGGRNNSSRNFPGVDGNPPLVINASRFVVYFRSDGSNNDWGYKINCSFAKPKEVDSNKPFISVLNNGPFYFGQHPGYIQNTTDKTSMSGDISQVAVYQSALSEDDIAELYRARPMTLDCFANFSEVDCLRVMSMLQRGSVSFDSFAVHEVASPAVLVSVMRLIAHGAGVVPFVALRLLSRILPHADVEAVKVQAKFSGLMPTGVSSFAAFVLGKVGEQLNPWRTFSTSEDYEMKPCGESRYGIGWEYVLLLHAMIANQTWASLLSKEVSEIISSTFPRCISALDAQVEKESKAPSSKMASALLQDVDAVFAILGMFCGADDGLHSGAKARCLIGEGAGIPEECTILAPSPVAKGTAIPGSDDSSFLGVSYMVVLDSQPGEYLLVDRAKIFPLGFGIPAALETFIRENEASILSFYSLLTQLTCKDPRPMPLPNIVTTHQVVVVESAHPYASTELDVYSDHCLRGAKSIRIDFDSQCRLEGDDYIRFYKGPEHSDYYGDSKYSGRDGSGYWSKKSLVIPADHFVLHFRSERGNFEWGYKFTMTADCVERTDPPPIPPLLSLSILHQMKAYSLKSLSLLLTSCPWMVKSTIPMIGKLVSNALIAAPKGIHSSGGSAKPLIFESNHPYENNRDDYIPVRIKGAKKLLISFDDLTATEQNCDFIKIYRDESRGETWGETYSGGKDNGSSNFPGMRNRPPLVIPADNFVLHFHSDGSVNAWGYKMIVTPVGLGSSLGDVESMSAQEISYLHYCIQNFMVEGPAHLSMPIGLKGFKTAVQDQSAQLLSLGCFEAVADTSAIASAKTEESKGADVKSSISELVLNTRECNSLSLYEQAAETSPVLETLSANDRLTIVEEVPHSNWLRVKRGEQTGFVMRRREDSIFLVPFDLDAGKSNDGMITLEDDAAMKTGPSIHPMYIVNDESSTKSDSKSLPSPQEVLRGQVEVIENMVADTALLSSIAFSKFCVDICMSQWPNDVPFSLGAFGSELAFLSYLRRDFINGVVNKDAMRARILDVVRFENKSQTATTCTTLINFALRQLSDSLELLTPPRETKAIMKELESIHPYVDNMDQCYELSIPGAKWMKIVFDKNSATEKDCDYCMIYKDMSKEAAWSQSKYTGRSDSNDKCWAGINGVPPCIVKSDSCVVFFHSDGSNVDWGFKLYCYGIMEEPSEEELDALEKKRSAPDRPSPELAFWLIDFLAKEPIDSARQCLFTASALRTIRDVLDKLPKAQKSPIIHVITNLVQEVPKLSLNEETVQELAKLRASVTNMATTMYREEEKSAKGDVEISQVLQALIQCVIVFESVFSLKSNSKVKTRFTNIGLANWEVSGRTDVKSLSPYRVEKLGDVAKAAPNVPSKSMFSKLTTGLGLGNTGGSGPKSKSPSGSTDSPSTVLATNVSVGESFTFNIRITGEHDNLPSVGVARDAMSISWRDGVLKVSGFDPIQFGPQIASGDIVSVSVDYTRGTVDFYRNFAFIGTAVGPVGAKSAIEASIVVSSAGLKPTVTLFEPGDAAVFVNVPQFDCSSSSVQQDTSQAPDWLLSPTEAVTILRACITRDLPGTILAAEFLPQCEDADKVVFESAHPYPASGESRSEIFSFDEAEKVRITFDPSTRMNSEDIIRISEIGVDESVLNSVEYKGLDHGCVLSESIDNQLLVGDRVTRGPSWMWGNEDGGVGSIGTVVGVRAWKGASKAGISVKWDGPDESNFVGVYRYGAEGKFDLQRLPTMSGNARRPILVNTSKVKIDFISSMSVPATNLDSGSLSPWEGCAIFDGEYSAVSVSADVELDGNFTIECWVKAIGDAAEMPIVSRQIDIDGRKDQLSFSMFKKDDFYFLKASLLNTDFQRYAEIEGGAVKISAWTHVAVVMDGNDLSLFVNGLNCASTSSRNGERIGSMGAQLRIGASDGGAHFSGNMYDLRIWGSARTSTEILASKDSLFKSPQPLLLVNIPFDAHPIDDDGSTNRIIFDTEGRPHDASWVRFDESVEQPVLPVGSHYGYKITLKPVYSLTQVLAAPKFKSALRALTNQYTLGSLRHDLHIVKYINHVSREKKMDVNTLLSATWEQISPSSDDLLRLPVLQELANSSLTLETTTDNQSGENEKKKANYALSARFKVIQMLNKHLKKLLPYIDLCTADKPWSIAHLLLQCRGLVFESLKTPLLDVALSNTQSSGGQIELRLSRSRAAKHARTGIPDHDGRYMTFSQAMRQLHVVSPSVLRQSGKIYNTIFIGEHAQDAGGPYRESFSTYCLELQSAALPLMIRTPNGRHSVGQNREKWVLNPGATSVTHLEMLKFLGKLMGIAIRSKEYLDLDIAPIIWKLIVQDTPSREDLEAIDMFEVKSLSSLRDVESEGVTAETFSMVFFLTFTCMTADDRTIELEPDGSKREVTFENRMEYCDLVERYRLHEFDVQVDALRAGLATVVPMRLLSLFTWDQLEMMVCGQSQIDISLLRSVAEYSSCSANDEHVRNFWQVMEEFSQEERSMFLRFTWGRSRLPLNSQAFVQRFKLQSFPKSPPDNYLPISHTCFFSLELPRYSTLDIMRERLRYAIYNCTAIDGDDTSLGMQAAALGWEDE